MIRWLIDGAALVALLFAYSSLHAQVPAGPAAAAPVAAAAPAAAPAAPNNLWSFLCLTPAQKAACKQKLCASPLAGFLGSALAPARALSGGLLPQCCPGPNSPNPADLAKPADSAEGAAARIKKMEAEAKARRLAVRYLGTVDCKRFPEAEAALVNALRGDTNECVRFEAALALSHSCCCTKKVLEALVVTVSGRKTSDPAETSERVKAVASVALERCLLCYSETASVKPPETAPTPPAPARPKAPPPVPQRLPAPTAWLLPDPLHEDRPAPPTLLPGPPSPAPLLTIAPVPADPLLEEARKLVAARREQLARPLAAAPAPPLTPEPPLLSQTVQNAAVSAAPTAGQVASAAAAARDWTPAAPPADPTPNATAQASVVPPTGRHDVWSVFKNAMQGR